MTPDGLPGGAGGAQRLRRRAVPTQVRGTLTSAVGAVVVASGSVGLLLVGGLAQVLDAPAVVLLLAAVDAFGILLLRGLPETAGVDVIGPRPSPGGAA